VDRFCDRRKHAGRLLRRLRDWRDAHASGALYLSSQVVCRFDRTRRLRRERLAVLRKGWRRLDERQYTEDLLSTGGVTAQTQVLTDNRTGFTVGTGIEFGLVENLSGKIEYDFYDFGSKKLQFQRHYPGQRKLQSPHNHRRPQLVGRPQALSNKVQRAIQQGFNRPISAAAHAATVFPGNSRIPALANATRSHYVRSST